MARLASIPYGKFVAFITQLGNAGLTADLAEKVSKDPSAAEKAVRWMRIFSFGNWGATLYYQPCDAWIEIAPGVEMHENGSGIGVRILEVDSPEDKYFNVIALDFPVYQTIKQQGIVTLGDLATWEAYELLNLRGVGIEDVTSIRKGLAKYGLSLAGESN